ncbi:MAG: helix-turn-helix transcriptional regulator [Spirochaetales bacterium]|nr:helix-turn-helix transcriptional regulator [Candidatus Physcosoma equi]
MTRAFERPVVDIVETGRNIRELRIERNISIREIQRVLGFEYPQSIYNWETGKNMPSIDNLLVLSAFFNTPMEKIVGYHSVPTTV